MKVGFSGPFGDSNFGDYGMLVNNIYALGDVSGVTVYSYDDVTVGAFWEEYLTGVDSARYTVEFEVARLERLFEEGRNPTPLEILDAVVNLNALEQSVGGLDVMVVNGGGYWNELWCQPHRIEKLLTILVPVLIAQAFGVRIVFTSNGFGPFGPRSRFLIDLLPALNADFHVRDLVRSPAELRRMGVSDNRINFAPDDLFFYDRVLCERPVETLNLPESYIVFETYRPLDVLQEMRDELALLGSSMKSRGIEIVVLPLYGGRGGADQGDWLAGEFGWKQYEVGAGGFLRLEDASTVIGGAQLVACDRYHAAVLALSRRVPVVHSLRDVSGDKQYYYSKSMGAAYTAWGDRPKGSPHVSMSRSLETTLSRCSSNFEEVTSVQREMHDATPVEVEAAFRAMRLRVISRIWGEA